MWIPSRTKIYAEVRKGIRPEMYALSTLLFVSVLVLMICVNASPKESKDVKKSSKKMAFHRTFRFAVPAVLIIALIVGGIFYNINTLKNHSGEKVIVYNWGEYLDPKTIELFQRKKQGFPSLTRNMKQMKSCIRKLFLRQSLMMWYALPTI